MRLGRRKTYRSFSRHDSFLKKLIVVLLIVLAVLSISFLLYKYKMNYSGLPSMKSVYADWEERAYDKVYTKTEEILKRRPYDGEALALHGFASYYIFTEQTDFSIGHVYLNNAVLHLRQALYRVKGSERPKIAYLLGKAYYQKGYYYADLALKYLDEAYDSNIRFPDLAEFRAMSASLLGEADKAIDSFTQALAENPSDLLFFALAENYFKLGDEKNAKLYLFETIDKTNDILLELKCRYLLGTIFLDSGEIEKAENEFTAILEKDMNSADAYYGLGVVFEIRGDLIKARSQWRKALKFDPLHKKAREKLNLL